MHMVENLLQRMAYQREGRLLKSEGESSMAGAYDTHLTDLTTEETATSAELANSMQIGKTLIKPHSEHGSGQGR
jgi:hypothetical protein